MTPLEADSYASATAAYVHVPFCSAICPYCDFAVVAGRDDLVERYARALVAEIAMAEPWEPLQAVYFGGGTPSHVRPRLLGLVLEALEERHGIAADAEVSLEANPEDFGPDRAREYRSIGFNRVSFGGQSFDPGVLVELGRRHTGDQIVSSVEAARRAGFSNVSLDLIYGSPGETASSWSASLQRAAMLETEHVSAYALTVERGTPLGRSVSGGAPAPDPDVQADRYEEADRALRGAGMKRYEVSNWARSGFECRYNLTVWAQGEYEAYGNGAHGFRHGSRYRNMRRIDAYLESVEDGRLPRAGSDSVTGWNLELDRLFVGLRRSVGVSHGPGTEAFLGSGEGRLLASAGVVESSADRLRVSAPLLTDAVHRTVLAQMGPIVGDDGHA